ncbi:MAG: hypothetical protein U0W40_13545 [Acidimicrobiia bacterium]
MSSTNGVDAERLGRRSGDEQAEHEAGELERRQPTEVVTDLLKDRARSRFGGS